MCENFVPFIVTSESSDHFFYLQTKFSQVTEQLNMASVTGNTVPVSEYQIFEWIINHTIKYPPFYPGQSQCRQEFAIQHQIKDNEPFLNFFQAS